MVHPLTPAFTLFKNFNPFHSIIHYYVDLSCFLVSNTNPRDWWALNRRKRGTSLHTLEIKYQSSAVRDKFIAKGFRQSMSSKRTACLDRQGFRDFFVPVLNHSEVMGHLQVGAFRENEVDLQVLENSWRTLSGLEPSAKLTEFREFVRILLEIPVLDGPLFAAFQESLELYASLLSDDAQPDAIGQKLRRLLLEVFSKRLPHSYWMDWALGRPTPESTPPWNRGMEHWDWIRDEIGLIRIPTTVLTVIPQRPAGPSFDWTREMLRVYRFQRRSFLFAQTLPQTVGGKLEDYGAVFVTSADPKSGRLAQHQQIEAVARKIRDFSAKELGGPVLMGVGATVSPGELLGDSYHQAILALHLQREVEKDIVFYSERKKEKLITAYSQLRRVLDELNEAFTSATFSGLEALKERFLKLALNLSFQNPHEIRWHFRYALDRLAETVGNRMDMEKEERIQVRENLGQSLEEAANIQEIVTAFQEDLSKLERLLSRPSSLGRHISMEKVGDYINGHFMEPLRIASLAKMADVSVSTFGREFKRMTGSGLESHLQNRRIEEAKRLLKTTNLPVSRIVRDCGFKSASYFTRLFRRKTATTPQKYRQGSRGI